MNVDRLGYELQLMGKRVILTPILVMLGFAVFAGLLAYLHVMPARFLSGGLEMILPLSAGVIVATVISHDPAVELQLTMPRKYDVTGIRRLGLIAAWTAIIAVLSSLVISLLQLTFEPAQLKSWSAPLQLLANQLTWLAPLLWLVAVGLCLAMLTRSRSANGAMMCGIWLIEILFKDYFASTSWLKPIFLFPSTLTPGIDFWLTNRIEVIVIALVLLPPGWLLLRNPEGLLKGSSQIPHG